MDEIENKPKKPNKWLLIIALILIGLSIITFMVYEFTDFERDGLIRFDSFFFYFAVIAYLAGIAMFITWFVKRIKSRADSNKGSVYFPVLAIGCDVLAIFIFVVGTYLYIDLINEVGIILTGLLLPVAGILIAVYSLSLGRSKIGNAGFVISIIAIVIPAIFIGLTILYLSFLALILAFM